MGGTTGVEIPFYPIYLFDKDGKPVKSMVAAYAVHHDRSVNIADAYTEEGFDFTGTKNFDKKTGYRSQSFLTVPMKNHEGEIIGVLQLINAKDPAHRRGGRVLRHRPAPGRIARLSGGDRAHQPPADQPPGEPVRVVHQPHQRRDRRQVALHRRALPARADAHHDAGGGGGRLQGRPAPGFRDDGARPLRAQDRGIAARLRQGHDPGARRGQGDQAADHLRPHRPHRHALRGGEARRGDRAAQGAPGEARAAGARTWSATRSSARRHPRNRERPRFPAPRQHRQRGDEGRGCRPGAGDRQALPLAQRRGDAARFPERGGDRGTSRSAPARSPRKSARSSTTTSRSRSRCWSRCRGPGT